MLIAELKPGVYSLSKNVANPEKDRRVVRDWTKQPTWGHGDRFIVRVNHSDNKDKAFFEVVKEGSKYSFHRLTEFMPGFMPLIAALEPAVETLDTILTGQHNMAYNILESLVEDGKISLANVKEALDKIG